MNLQQLTESSSLSEIMDSPFLETYGTSNALYHGGNLSGVQIHEISFQYRGKPRDTPPIIHDIVNLLSVEKHGLPVRSLLFVSRSRAFAEDFGDNLFVVVPKGDDYRMFVSSGTMDFTDVAYKIKRSPIIASATSDNPKFISALTETGIDPEDAEGMLAKIISRITRYKITLDGLAEHFQTELDKINMGVIARELQDAYVDAMKQVCGAYVSNIEELTSNEQFGTNRHEEVMVYAPSGFYLVPEHQFQ